MSQFLPPNLPPFEDITDAEWRDVYESAALIITARHTTQHWPEWRDRSPEAREGFKHAIYARWTRMFDERDDR